MEISSLCLHHDAEEVFAVAPAIASLFVSILVVADDKNGPLHSILSLPVITSPNQMHILLTIRLHRTEHDVSMQNMAVAAGHNWMQEASIPAAGERVQTVAAAFKLDRLPCQEHLFHDFLSLCREKLQYFFVEGVGPVVVVLVGGGDIAADHEMRAVSEHVEVFLLIIVRPFDDIVFVCLLSCCSRFRCNLLRPGFSRHRLRLHDMPERTYYWSFSFCCFKCIWLTGEGY